MTSLPGECGNRLRRPSEPLASKGAASSSYTGCTQESLSVTALTNNQLSATGIFYDASGNILGDGKNTYVWNAESEIKTGSGVNYTYDGDGDRVQKSNGKIYWYGMQSDALQLTGSREKIAQILVRRGRRALVEYVPDAVRRQCCGGSED
jgi:hypothetical protein